jgi:hypothetical protein
MTDLKPLRESSADGFAKGLLESAFLDEPPHRSLRKTAVFLGMSEAAVATLAASSATGAAPGVLGTAGASALSASAAGGGKAVLVVALKWLGAGAIVGAATAGGIDYLSDPPTAPAAIAPASAAARSAAEHASNPIGTVVAATAEPATARPEAPSAPHEPPTKPRAIADTPAPDTLLANPVDPPPALDGEIRRLDRARAALAAGSSEAALAELAAYENERKTAVLEREAAVLRIDALLARGDLEGAQSLAQRYVAAHPDDPHARRLRKLLETGGGAR